MATLHAAAVATEVGAVLLLGRSGIGKSSLAAALVERGYPLLADDVTGVMLDAGGRPVALPAFAHQKLWAHTLDKMKWRPRARAKVRRDMEKYWVRAERHCATPLPVRAAFVLNAERRPDIAIESVSPSAAFWTLWRYTHYRRVMGALGQRPAHFRAVTTMAWSVPLGRAVRPKTPFLLEALTDRIEAHLCKAGPSGNGEARKKTPPELPAAFRRSPDRRPPSVPPVTRRHDRVAAAPSCARTGDGVAGASGRGIVWLASYPKSGNTWLRAVLTNYLREDDEPASINALAGKRYNSRALFDEFVGIKCSDMTDAEVARYRARLREFLVEKFFAARAVSGETFHRDGRFFGKTHEAYRVPDGPARFRRGGTAGVVYLVRNPLDVAVSFAHHTNRSIDHIIRSMADPAAIDPPTVHGISDRLPEAMTTWSGHVSSWTAQSELSIHIARYEDLLKDPCSGFGAIVRFAGLEWDDARLDRAIGHAAFPPLARAGGAGRLRGEVAGGALVLPCRRGGIVADGAHAGAGEGTGGRPRRGHGTARLPAGRRGVPARVDHACQAGWPRAVTRPRLPQTRACPIRASGSSDYGFATQRYTLCTTHTWGREQVLRNPGLTPTKRCSGSLLVHRLTAG